LIGPQHGCDGAEGSPAADTGARRGSAGKSRLPSAMSAAIGQLFRLRLADRRSLAGEPTERGTDRRSGYGGSCVEIRRAGDAVGWRRLDPGAFAFRTALADGLTLAATAATATVKDPILDLAAALDHVFAEGLAVAFGQLSTTC